MGLNHTSGPPLLRRESSIISIILVTYFIIFNLFFNVFGQRWEFTWGVPVELMTGIGLIAVSVLLGRWLAPLRFAATTVIVLAAGFHLIDTAGRAIHGRRLDLVFDVAQFPHIFDLLAASLPTWLVWLAVAIVTLVLAGVLVGTALASRRLFNGVQTVLEHSVAPRIIAIFLLSASALSISDSEKLLGDRPVFTTAQGLNAATYHVETIYLWVDGGKSALNAVTADRKGIRDGETTLPGLKDTDIILIFIESYAASLYEREAHLETMNDLYTRYGVDFAEKNLHVASTLMDSPTYGGLSWLAHLTLTSGARLDRNLTYRAYLNSGLDTLQTILGRTGHETVLIKPGIKRFWPEGGRLRFDRLDTAKDVPYDGPDFGYFALPDQVSLAHLATVVAEQSGTPRLAQIDLISSHYPFRPLPPFLENPDDLTNPAQWDRAIERQKESEDWKDPVEGYRLAIAYTLRSVLDFVNRTADDNDLIIVVGDHQPWRIVSGNLGGRATPMHLIAKDQRLIERFLDHGYTSGLMPDTKAPPMPMEDFLPLVVRLFQTELPK